MTTPPKGKTKKVNEGSKQYRFFLENVLEWMESGVEKFPTLVTFSGGKTVVIDTPLEDFDMTMDDFNGLTVYTYDHRFPHKTYGTPDWSMPDKSTKND